MIVDVKLLNLESIFSLLETSFKQMSQLQRKRLLLFSLPFLSKGKKVVQEHLSLILADRALLHLGKNTDWKTFHLLDLIFTVLILEGRLQVRKNPIWQLKF